MSIDLTEKEFLRGEYAVKEKTMDTNIRNKLSAKAGGLSGWDAPEDGQDARHGSRSAERRHEAEKALCRYSRREREESL